METTIPLSQLDSGPGLYQQLLDAGSDGFFVYDAEFRYILWSKPMEQIWGISEAEVLGKNAFDVFPFLLESGEGDFFKLALRGQSAVSRNRSFYIPQSGRSGFFEARHAPLRGKKGQILGGIAILRDVTEQTIAADLLRETEARFQKMADFAPVMLWMSGTDSLCNFFNQTWLEFTGRTLEQEWGVGWAEGVHAEDFQKCMDTYVAAFNERRAFEMEYRLRRHDGQYRWILDRGKPRYTPEGIFAGFIGSCTDITERMELEIELRQAIRARDEFLSIASHELKTPLSALSLHLGMFDHLLAGNFDLAKIQERVEKLGKVAAKQLQRLTELIEDLLSVSRMSSGQFSLEKGKLDLSRLAKDVIERVKDIGSASGCSVHLESDEIVEGTWDQTRLEQVLTNLLMNAFRYASGKPVEVQVTVTNGKALLSVRDHGIGISQENQTAIFEKFRRGVSSRNYGGLGLGLYISKTIVDRHGGRIWVESELQQGSTFFVELPLAS